MKAQIKDFFILDENEMKNITGGGDILNECTRVCEVGRSCRPVKSSPYYEGVARCGSNNRGSCTCIEL